MSYNRLRENNKTVNDELLYKLSKQDKVTVNTLEEKENIISKLRKDLRIMEEECLQKLNTNTRDLVHTKRVNSDYKEEIEKLRNDRKENKKQIEMLEAKVASLQLALSAKGNDYDMKLECEMNKHAKTRKELSTTQNGRKEVEAKYQKSLEKIGVMLKEHREVLSRLEKYEKKISDLELENKKITQIEEVKTLELKQTTDMLEKFRNNIAQHKQDAEKQFTEEKERLQQQLETERKRNSELYSDNSQMRTEFSRKLKELTERETNRGDHFEKKYKEKEEESSKLLESFKKLQKTGADTVKMMKITINNLRTEMKNKEEKYDEKLKEKDSEIRRVYFSMDELHKKTNDFEKSQDISRYKWEEQDKKV